ncbi:MAG: vanadium-dependent haloperoxidase [Candidatus Dormibacteraceae bacterium]
MRLGGRALLAVGLTTLLSCTNGAQSDAPASTAPSFTAAATAARTTAPTAAPIAPTAVFTWTGVAQRVAITNAKQLQTQSLIYIAYVEAAIYDAAVAIGGRYEPYLAKIAAPPGASLDAAVASAAHDVLVRYFPDQAGAIDTDLATALGTIANGDAKTNGIAIGKEAAAALIDRRRADGAEADSGFSVPSPAPGAWQPPKGQAPQTPWVAKLRPFILDRPDQFRLPPPPAITSAEWAKDYNEVKAVGGTTSAVRTAEQTDVAKFWTTNGIVQYLVAYRALAEAKRLDAVDTARLYAMGTIVGADALIACFDAKYAYAFWRPQYAIPQGDAAGSPAISGDPAWTPLAATPNHPEYPAAHGCLTGAQADIFAAVLGTPQIDLDLTSTVAGLTQPSRHYRTVDELKTEIVNARVWAGLHYRNSVAQGLDLARKVVAFDLAGRFGKLTR